MSARECPAVIIKMEKLQDTDKLSKVMVGGFQLIVRTDDWSDGQLAVHLPPDSIVPETEQFAFLGKNKRIKIRAFCGYPSEGLLVKAPDGVQEGDDCAGLLGITHYEPEINYSTRGNNEDGPSLQYPKYDIENIKGHSSKTDHINLIEEGEEVVITEKIHGSNGKFVFHNGKIYCGSRANWKKESFEDMWWNTLRQNAWIEGFICNNDDVMVFGEVYGQVQNLKYGTIPGELRFAIFDMLVQAENKTFRWLDYEEARNKSRGCVWVPELYRGPFNLDMAKQLAESDSVIKGANHHKEGVVIQPIINRYHPKVGRIKFKLISNRYLEKS